MQFEHSTPISFSLLENTHSMQRRLLTVTVPGKEETDMYRIVGYAVVAVEGSSQTYQSTQIEPVIEYQRTDRVDFLPIGQLLKMYRPGTKWRIGE